MNSKSLVVVSLFLAACASLPSVPDHALVDRPPPAGPVELCWLEVGGLEAPARYGAGGWTTADTWHATTSVLRVRHPKGELLIDSGLSVDPASEVKELSAWKRFVFGQTAGRNEKRGDLRSLLDAVHAGPPLAIIISHAHADHLGGVAQLPGVPVWLSAEEAAFVKSDLAEHGGVVIPAQGRALEGRVAVMPFDSGPFLSYPRSQDVFGDGSVVVVPTFGHTPGSVSTVVTLPDGRRLMHVGDLINLQESIDRKVPKSKVMRALTDEDSTATDVEVAKLVQLHALQPELFVLPAHDRSAYEKFFGAMEIGGAPKCVNSAQRVAHRAK